MRRETSRKTKRNPARQRRRTPDEAKLEIIQVAREFLSKRPFRELTVGKLMERTQISRSAFYAHFKDVYDLAEIFVHEIAENIEAGGASWVKGEGDLQVEIRETLDNAITFWETHGPLIAALEQAAAQDKRLGRIWRDRVAVGPIDRVAEIIRRDQASGLIPPMDAIEMSVALNRFNMTYLNDRFGGAHHTRDRTLVLDVLERVWLATLYGRTSTSTPKQRRR